MGKITIIEPNYPKFDECKITKPQISHLKAATRIASSMSANGTPDGLDVTLVVIQQCATFDGKKWEIEEIEKLGLDFFTEVSGGLGFELPGTGATKAEA